MGRLRRLLLAATGIGLVIAASASTSPSQVPLARARLQGNFEVVTRITSASGVEVKRGSTDEGYWGFRPFCGSGACDVRLTFRYEGASMDRHRLTMTLDRRGAAYRGTGTATFLECFYKDVRGPVTIDLRVTRAAFVRGVWRATRIKGSYVHTTPAATSGVYQCPASRVTASISGSLEDR